jgi:Na+/phosphate symporter
MVQTGGQRAFGAKLFGFVGRMLKHRFSSFFDGACITALPQRNTTAAATYPVLEKTGE